MFKAKFVLANRERRKTLKGLGGSHRKNGEGKKREFGNECQRHRDG